MKRKTKNGSAIYSYLDSQGVLEAGNNAQIQEAKKKYWADYRRKYKKIKRKESKSFEIFFSFKEMKIIKRETKRHRISSTNYIRQSALKVGKSIIDPVAVGKIRKVLFMNYNVLLEISKQNKVTQELGNQLLEQMLDLEKKVLAFLNSN